MMTSAPGASAVAIERTYFVGNNYELPTGKSHVKSYVKSMQKFSRDTRILVPSFTKCGLQIKGVRGRSSALC
jgi:hypothetical protein